jgi:hypothetical protein
MLTEIGLFRTPEDWDEVMHWINLHNPKDRAHLVTAAAMSWNLAAKLTNPQKETEEEAMAEEMFETEARTTRNYW